MRLSYIIIICGKLVKTDIDEYGRGSLLRAAMNGDLDQFVGIYQNETKPMDLLDRNGDNAMHLAAMAGNQDVVEFLLREGADPNKRDRFGATPLHLAAISGLSDTVKLLCRNKQVDVNIADISGNTPIMVAGRKGHRRSFYYLLKAGAKTDIQNEEGKTLEEICLPSTKAMLFVYAQSPKEISLEDIKLKSIPLELEMLKKSSYNTQSAANSSKTERSMQR